MLIIKTTNFPKSRERERLDAITACVGEVEKRQETTEQDVNMLADTVLALCDIIEGGDE